MIELRSLFLAHVIHVVLCMGAILVDRRRLDAFGRARMWHRSTLWLVGSGLFLPPLLGWYAHFTITRRGSVLRRHGFALLSSALLVVALELCTQVAFYLLDWSIPIGGLSRKRTTRVAVDKT